MNFSTIIDLVKETFSEWMEDKASRLAAAIAYYTIFSLAPLVIITLSILGLVFQSEVAEQYLGDQVTALVGADGGEVFQQIAQNASRPSEATGAAIIGIAILLFGASGVFGQLQDSLNTVWEVAPKPGQGIWGIIKSRFLSFTMVLGVGFLLMVSLVISALLAAVGEFISGYFIEYVIIGQIINFLISFGFITLLFAMMFKILPDVEIAWGDVWIGAIVTALLFVAGKFLLGWYLGQQTFGSTNGAAGSILIILLWVYYSAQILLLGAEFTQVYAHRFGSRIVPDENAVLLDEETRAKQGIPRATQVEAAAQQQEGASQAEKTASRQKRTGQPEEPVQRREKTDQPQQQPKPALVTTDKPYTPFSIMWLVVLFLGIFVGAIRNKG
jgi:membrane protein